jgi:uncharacterized membrane protein YfcA
MTPELFYLAAIAFLGALVFGISGFGAALVTIPLATHLVPLKFALALFVLVDLACALRVGFEKPKNAVRAEWTRLVPMIVAGTAVGVTVLVNLPRQAATVALGLFIVAYALYSLSKPSLRKIAPGWAWLAGFAGGITSTVFGAGGPPYVMYLSRRGLSAPQLRATLGGAGGAGRHRGRATHLPRILQGSPAARDHARAARERAVAASARSSLLAAP